MAVHTNLVPAPPTDTNPLGRNYLLASTPALESALKHIEFELRMRADRDRIAQETKNRSADRFAEIASAITAITTPYDVETQGL